MRVANSVVHVAGKTGADGFLRCPRCLAILQDHRALSFEQLLALPYSVYPEGALIEVGRGFQSMTLETTEPTCAPAAGWLRVSYRAIEEAFNAGGVR